MNFLFQKYARILEKNPQEWLSSDEITDVMKQYEDKYDNFVFLGPSPIDFESANTNIVHDNKEICVWPELCNFNLKAIFQIILRKLG